MFVCSSVSLKSLEKLRGFFSKIHCQWCFHRQTIQSKKLRYEDLMLQHAFAKARTKNEELIFASHGDGDCVWATESVANRHSFVATEGLFDEQI